MVTNDGANINFTVSIGFTIFDNSHPVIDDLIKTADKALYSAKQQGRNRVVFL